MSRQNANAGVRIYNHLQSSSHSTFSQQYLVPLFTISGIDRLHEVHGRNQQITTRQNDVQTGGFPSSVNESTNL